MSLLSTFFTRFHSLQVPFYPEFISLHPFLIFVMAHINDHFVNLTSDYANNYSSLLART